MFNNQAYQYSNSYNRNQYDHSIAYRTQEYDPFAIEDIDMECENLEGYSDSPRYHKKASNPPLPSQPCPPPPQPPLPPLPPLPPYHSMILQTQSMASSNSTHNIPPVTSTNSASESGFVSKRKSRFSDREESKVIIKDILTPEIRIESDTRSPGRSKPINTAFAGRNIGNNSGHQPSPLRLSNNPNLDTFQSHGHSDSNSYFSNSSRIESVELDLGVGSPTGASAIAAGLTVPAPGPSPPSTGVGPTAAHRKNVAVSSPQEKALWKTCWSYARKFLKPYLEKGNIGSPADYEILSKKMAQKVYEKELKLGTAEMNASNAGRIRKYISDYFDKHDFYEHQTKEPSAGMYTDYSHEE